VRRPLLVAALALACAAVTFVLMVGLMHQDDVEGAAVPTGPAPSLEAAPFEPFDAPTVKGEVIAGEGAGTTIDLRSLRGRPVVINFWASWCDPCRREAPDLVAFARDHPGVAMLGVNANDSRAQAVPFANELGFDWPSIEGGNDLLEDFKLNGLPGTFVIDPAGQVVYRKLGTVTAAELAAAVRDRA
jgi:thiol-disulfide isomerase/thioredoxin